jgi:integrase
LQEHVRQFPPVDGWLFCYASGRPIHPRFFQAYVWKPMFQHYGVLLPYRPPHTLRHTYASLLLDKGASLAYVKDQLGHGSIQTTVDIYHHRLRSESRRAVDLLDDLPDDVARRKSDASNRLVPLKVHRGGLA